MNKFLVGVIILMLAGAAAFGLWLDDLQPIVLGGDLDDIIAVDRANFPERFNTTPEIPDDLWPETQQPVVKEVVKEIPVIVTQNITTEKIVEKIVYNRDVQEWQSVAECEAWIVDHMRVVMSVGTKYGDCDDTATYLQEQALKEGRPISQALTQYGKYFDVPVTRITVGHAGCMVLIDNYYYWFDPNPKYYEGLVKITNAD